MPDGILNLRVVDVYGVTVAEPVDIFLRHQTLAHDPTFRGLKPAKTITIKDLHQSPQGLYRLEVDAPSYLPVSQFVNIRSDGPTPLTITLPVNKDRVVGVTFPPFTSLIDDAQRLLNASNDVLSFGQQTGAALYDSFDDLRKAGFLNLVIKAGHTRLLSNRSVLSYLDQVTDQRGDRLFALTGPALHAEVLHSRNDDLFHPVPDALHQPPPGFTAVDSYKTLDHYGNLQLTFATNGALWSVDMDLDDAQGFEHVFQVLHNTLTGQPTHPYNIHEILVASQELDPAYHFNLVTTPRAAAGTA
ncbi:MAG TPA: hypothetical protein VNH18_33590 [Bryobacteraceae bacterium]|nr:hypothetical protein [Bryobacteraceae bacterium]